MIVMGIDIGGSGIKGAPVDTRTGQLVAKRYRLDTPQPSKPRAVAKVVGKIVKHHKWSGVVGCGFPAVIQNGTALTAANVHDDWIGTNAVKLLTKATNCLTYVGNDADVAGLAEMRFGVGRGRRGVVMMVTIGTGLGTSLFLDGRLVPNTELGHLELRGGDAEHYASDAVRKKQKLSWKKFGRRFNEYLQTLEKLFWPNLFIIGGGASKKHERFFPYLKVHADVLPAGMFNEAGIVGAALAVQAFQEKE